MGYTSRTKELNHERSSWHMKQVTGGGDREASSDLATLDASLKLVVLSIEFAEVFDVTLEFMTL